MSGEPLSIGKVAKATGTKVETIRYYESVGLRGGQRGGDGVMIAFAISYANANNSQNRLTL